MPGCRLLWLLLRKTAPSEDWNSAVSKSSLALWSAVRSLPPKASRVLVSRMEPVASDATGSTPPKVYVLRFGSPSWSISWRRTGGSVVAVILLPRFPRHGESGPLQREGRWYARGAAFRRRLCTKAMAQCQSAAKLAGHSVALSPSPQLVASARRPSPSPQPVEGSLRPDFLPLFLTGLCPSPTRRCGGADSRR